MLTNVFGRILRLLRRREHQAHGSTFTQANIERTKAHQSSVHGEHAVTNAEHQLYTEFGF